MSRTESLLLLWVFLAAASAEASPKWAMAPVQQMRSRVSVGPTVGVAPVLTTQGAQGLVSVGFGVGVFDLWGVTDPACEERRREERAALGGDRISAWGKVIERAQQPCRLIEQGWRPGWDLGLEVGFAPALLDGRQSRSAQLRAWFAPVSFWQLTLGASAAVVSGELQGERAVGMRLGPELAWHHRLGGPDARRRHVLSVVLRPEVSLVGTDVLPHQVVLGGRFLFDL